jgi:hypothetical protein
MYPNILSALGGKIMDIAQGYAETTYREWAVQMPSVPDFKPKTILQIGENAELPRLPDGDRAEQSKVAEEASYIAVDAYADLWKMTPRMLVDDDLNAFQEAATDKSVAAEYTLNRLCIELLTGNVNAADGNALYGSAHANDVASGGAPSVTQLAPMRKLMRLQKGVSGKRALNLRMSSILVPAALETATEQIVLPIEQLNGGVQPTTDATTNPFRGKLKMLVDPMLDDASAVQWYVFANPAVARAIIFCFMQGYEQLRRTIFWENESGSMVLKVEGRFAAAIRNWRGTVRNAGQ